MRIDSRLQKSRHGIYYLRLHIDAIDRRWSLHTRDPKVALIAAYAFAAKLLTMKNEPKRPMIGWVLEDSRINLKIATVGSTYQISLNQCFNLLTSIYKDLVKIFKI